MAHYTYIDITLSRRSQREAVAIIHHILTSRGHPYHYLLTNLEGEKLPYKFMAKDLQPAPSLKKLKLTVNKILSRRRGDEALVSFYGYPRSVSGCTFIILPLFGQCDMCKVGHV